MAIIEQRLDSIESTLDHLLRLHGDLIKAMLEMKQQNTNTQNQIGQINRRIDQTNQRIDQTDRRIVQMDRRIDLMQQELEGINRSNLQTRRLWIIMARKHNMLDDDDITEWMQENP